MGYLGDTLREERVRRGLSLRQASQLIGCQHQHLGRVERGEVVAPTPAYLLMCVAAYGVTEGPLMDAARAPDPVGAKLKRPHDVRKRIAELRARLTTHLCSDGYATGAIAWSPHWLRRESCSLKGVDE